MDNIDRVTGWWLFAGILLTIAGVLNIIWGIAAISESRILVENDFGHSATFVFSNLNTWGWITLILGALEVLAGFSLFAGSGFGRWFGIAAAALVAWNSLFDVGVRPFWSICVFALSIIIIFQLARAPEAGSTS